MSKPMSNPFRANREHWIGIENSARHHSSVCHALLELRSRIEALEAAEPAPDQQAAAAEPEPQQRPEPNHKPVLGLPSIKDAGRRVRVRLGNGDVVEGRLVHVGYSHPYGEYGMPQPLFDVFTEGGPRLSLSVGSRWRFADDNPAQSEPKPEPSNEPQPEADQPAAEPPFKPGQIWRMRSRRVVKITSVENYHDVNHHNVNLSITYHDGNLCITFADYPFDNDTLLIYYRPNGEALLDTNNRNYDLIELFSGPK